MDSLIGRPCKSADSMTEAPQMSLSATGPTACTGELLEGLPVRHEAVSHTPHYRYPICVLVSLTASSRHVDLVQASPRKAEPGTEVLKAFYIVAVQHFSAPGWGVRNV